MILHLYCQVLYLLTGHANHLPVCFVIIFSSRRNRSWLTLSTTRRSSLNLPTIWRKTRWGSCSSSPTMISLWVRPQCCVCAPVEQKEKSPNYIFNLNSPSIHFSDTVGVTGLGQTLDEESVYWRATWRQTSLEFPVVQGKPECPQTQGELANSTQEGLRPEDPTFGPPFTFNLNKWNTLEPQDVCSETELLCTCR